MIQERQANQGIKLTQKTRFGRIIYFPYLPCLVFFTWLRIVLPMKKEATWSGSTFCRRSLLTFSMVSISSLSVWKQRSKRKSTRQPSSSWEKDTAQIWKKKLNLSYFVSKWPNNTHGQQTHTSTPSLLETTEKMHEYLSSHTYLSGKYKAYYVKDDQPNPWHDLRVLQHARPVE